MFARLFLYRLISRCAHAHSPHSDSCWKDTITPLWWATGQCFFLRGEVPLVFRFIPVVRKLAGKETSGQCHNLYVWEERRRGRRKTGGSGIVSILSPNCSKDQEYSQIYQET
uniref:Secreted protein n=1 Tax=Palpitomonas bilix TaxID=652834 RepID=A0A7S3G3H3_9EUKA